MKKYNKIIFLFASLALAVLIFSYSLSVMGKDTYFDFENESFSWNPLYDNADYEFLTEENGNTYLKLTNNGKKNRDRDYFDVSASSEEFSSEKTQINYDVMYPEFTEDRNGEMQFKYRTGPGSTETTMIARVAQLNGYLQVQGGNGVGYQRVRDIDGNYFKMETGHWYTIKMTIDLENHIQTTYVFDRDTESLLAIHEEISTINEATIANMVSFSSKTSICLDNVSIGEVICERGHIYGNPYPKRGTKTRYYFLGMDANASETAFIQGSTVWSIVNPVPGVSINSTSGNLNCSTSAEPGTVIIKAERTVGNTVYEDKFVVSITN